MFVHLVPTVLLIVAYLLLTRSSWATWRTATEALQQDGPGIALRTEMQRRGLRAKLRASLIAAAGLILLLVVMATLAAYLAARQDHGVLTVESAFWRAMDQMLNRLLLAYGLSLVTALIVIPLIIGELFGLRAAQRVLATAGHTDPAAGLLIGWGRSAVLLFGIAGAALSLTFGATAFAMAFAAAASTIACAQPGSPKCY